MRTTGNHISAHELSLQKDNYIFFVLSYRYAILNIYNLFSDLSVLINNY